MAEAEYDPRYLAGIVLFNRHDFFEAHEVWEDLWHETAGEDRRFYQALIQAAVALCHFGNGNLRGATKLFRSARDYMQRYAPQHMGLDVTRFWDEMGRCFAAIIEQPEPVSGSLDESLVPTITLDPAPPAWPDPAPFLPEDDN